MAFEIVPQIKYNYTTVKYGQIPWLDAAINRPGQNVPINDADLKEFFMYAFDNLAPIFQVIFDNQIQILQGILFRNSINREKQTLSIY